MINVTEQNKGTEPSNEVMVSGREHMVRIMKMAANDYEAECEVTATEVLKAPEKNRFRSFSHKFTENAVTGLVSENMFYNMCRAAIHDRLDFTTRTQTNGQWRLLAWEISSGKGLTRTRVPYSGPRDWDRFKSDPANYGHGVPSPQNTEHKMQEVDQLVFTYVVLDTYQNEELDLMQLREGRPDVTMTKFLETGEHKFLPPPLRKQRDQSLELLSAYVKGESSQKKSVSKLTGKQFRQVQALRTSGEQWKDLAPLFGMSWTQLRKAYESAEAKENRNGTNGVGAA